MVWAYWAGYETTCRSGNVLPSHLTGGAGREKHATGVTSSVDFHIVAMIFCRLKVSRVPGYAISAMEIYRPPVLQLFQTLLQNMGHPSEGYNPILGAAK